MTQARTRANEVGFPSPSQLSLTAMLRAFVELVLHAVSTLRMVLNRKPRDWHTQLAQDVLPRETNGIQQQEVQPDRRAPARPSARSAETTPALMVSSARSARLSNHEGVLTPGATPTGSFPGLSRESRLAHHRDHQLIVPLVPMKIGTQCGTRGLLRIEAAIPCKAHHRSWMPIFIGMSGEIAPTSAPA